MATLNAASRLRNQVLAVPNTVLLFRAGHVDQVLRFNRLPEILTNWRKTKAAELGFSEYPNIHTPLNLDNGPDSETWAAAVNEMKSVGRRDRPLPLPLDSAESSNDDWSVAPEDVPLVELSIITVDSKPDEVAPVVAPVGVDKRSKAYRDSVKV